MRTGVLCLAVVAMLFVVPPPAARADTTVPAALDRLYRADGVSIVPERFLRRWDPVTVFLDHDAGPGGGGPEDMPERYAVLMPAQPGAWQWLGPRVLQFRPAEPWRPLRRVASISAPSCWRNCSTAPCTVVRHTRRPTWL